MAAVKLQSVFRGFKARLEIKKSGAGLLGSLAKTVIEQEEKKHSEQDESMRKLEESNRKREEEEKNKLEEENRKREEEHRLREEEEKNKLEAIRKIEEEKKQAEAKRKPEEGGVIGRRNTYSGGEKANPYGVFVPGLPPPPTKPFYTYEELMHDPQINRKPPPECDPSKLESYLSDEGFRQLFKMSKQEFNIQPPWRTRQLKVKLRLW